MLQTKHNRERTSSPVRVFAARLHATGCFLRETQAILRLIGVERSHQAIWNWVPRLADSVPDPPTELGSSANF